MSAAPADLPRLRLRVLVQPDYFWPVRQLAHGGVEHGITPLAALACVFPGHYQAGLAYVVRQRHRHAAVVVSESAFPDEQLHLSLRHRHPSCLSWQQERWTRQMPPPSVTSTAFS